MRGKTPWGSKWTLWTSVKQMSLRMKTFVVKEGLFKGNETKETKENNENKVFKLPNKLLRVF